MERRIPTVFVATHGAYPYITENNKIHMQYKIIPKDMTVYILETASLGVCNINTAFDNNLIGNEIEKYMKYGMHKEDLIYEIVDFMDEAHKDYTLVDEELHNTTAEEKKEDEDIIHSRKEEKMYSLKKLVGGNFYYDKIFSRETKDSRAYNENNSNNKNKYDMRINFMNLEINKGFEDIRDSTIFREYDMLEEDMDKKINLRDKKINLRDKKIYLSNIIQRIYDSGFRYVIIIDNSCSSLYNEGDIELASKDNLHKLYNDMQFVWLNTNIPNEHHEKKRKRLLNQIHDFLNEEKLTKKQRKGGKRRKSKNHRRKITNRKTYKKRLDRR